MSAQLFPFWSHCCHWYENVLTPVQVPLFAVSDSPTRGVPLMVGRAVFFGLVRAATTPLPFVSALPVPSVFVARTFACKVCSMSAVVAVYDCAVAPEIGTQFWRSPVGSQRSHWYTYFVGLPDHDPFVTVSLSPTKGCVAGP